MHKYVNNIKKLIMYSIMKQITSQFNKKKKKNYIYK